MNDELEQRHRKVVNELTIFENAARLLMAIGEHRGLWVDQADMVKQIEAANEQLGANCNEGLLLSLATLATFSMAATDELNKMGKGVDDE